MWGYPAVSSLDYVLVVEKRVTLLGNTVDVCVISSCWYNQPHNVTELCQ